jgi:ABC-type transporter Mla maintaining outer membrane lipid asymmetry permease subunit MlaE
MSADNDASGSGGSLGGAGGAAAGAGEGVKPDWDAFDVGKISDKLAEIMLILGAALMAVGAVLAFSGINIPLGLTLMAIGALMIYTAYREKWDELPEKVRSSITTALVVVGIVAVVLGAVLAFSGVNVPLGIGLMAAGLTLLGVAAALNWDALGTELRTAITMALLVVGVIALVVGAVLAFSGANIPLGLGLMALGALSIATAAVLNWEALTGSLSEAVATALEVAGIVAVALGAALAFSAVNIPLGLALIALGAAALVGAVALDWKRMGGDLKRTVTKALEVVGIVAVVIGAVLAFT